MPAAVSDEERLDAHVLTRVTHTEKDHLRRESARRGLTVSEAKRRALVRDGLLPTSSR